MSANQQHQQSPQINSHVPSRFDLMSADTTASNLLDNILTDYSPKSWFYFLEHILNLKTNGINGHHGNDTNNHLNNAFCYSFETFNKFFKIFKDGNHSNHDQLNKNDIFYGEIWILHVRSHLIDYHTNYQHKSPQNLRKNKLQIISSIYKKMYKAHIATNNGQFFIDWAKYYIDLRKKKEKAKKILTIAATKQLQIAQTNFTEYYLQMLGTNAPNHANNYLSHSDLGSSSDSQFADHTESENDDDATLKHRNNMDIDENDANNNYLSRSRSTRSFMFGKPPQRVISSSFNTNCTTSNTNSQTDSDHFDEEPPQQYDYDSASDSQQNDQQQPGDEDGDESGELFVEHKFGHKLQQITENGIFSPLPPKNDLKRTPFVTLKKTKLDQNINTLNSKNLSVSVAKKRLVPFTPNTLIRNMCNNQHKSFSFSQSKRQPIQRNQMHANDLWSCPRCASPQKQSNGACEMCGFVNQNQKYAEKENHTPHKYSRPKSQSTPLPMPMPMTIATPLSNRQYTKYVNNVSPFSDKKSESDSRRPSNAKSRSKSNSPPNNINVECKHEPNRTNSNSPKKKRVHLQLQRDIDRDRERERDRRERVNNNNKRQRPPKPRQNKLNIIRIKGREIMVLKRIGRGGSSEVFQVITRDTLEIFALKKIKVSGSVEPDSNRDPMENFLNEIDLLIKLRHKPYCIQMVDYEIMTDLNHNPHEIRMLFECGEIDLSHLLKQEKKGFFEDINAVKNHWTQMLLAVNTVHSFNIIHGDLKPANFLMVKGKLKLIDFGIAKEIVSNETTRISRESQIGTLNYISPEALIASDNGPNGDNQYKLGRSADVWSLGCILHQMLFGFTPFTHLKFAPKLQAIISPSCCKLIKIHEKKYVSEIIKHCLMREPKKRIAINELINHAFLD